MDWVSRVAHKMRRCTLLREQLGDLSSQPEDIYRPKGMKRYIFQRKVSLLARLEDSYMAEIEFKLGKWHKAKLNRTKTKTIQGKQ